MRVVRDKRATLPGRNANADRPRESGETPIRKRAARLCRFWSVAVCFQPSTKLQRNSFEVQRFKSKDRKRPLRGGWRQSFFTGRREVTMLTPESEAAREPSFLFLIEDSLEEKGIVFERRAYFTGGRLDFSMLIVVELDREGATFHERSVFSEAASKFETMPARI